MTDASSLVAIGIALGLVGFALGAIAWPLVRGSNHPETPTDAAEEQWSDLRRLRHERASILEAIRELDGEAALGNVNAEDHRALRTHYVHEAAIVIRAIEGQEHVLDDEIDLAIAERRAARTTKAQNSRDERGRIR
ncbi:MAG: hypothetical protein O3B84_02795 [Chloroflexi bacterium]|nr:hypothetical protein [Chloroflexota bacterium]